MASRDSVGQPLSFRFPSELIKRIDAFAAGVAARNLGIAVTRTDAIRMLIELGLAAGEQPQKATKAKAKKR